jgi:ATP-dependent Clp protease ATP-binding subunit ClpB
MSFKDFSSSNGNDSGGSGVGGGISMGAMMGMPMTDDADVTDLMIDYNARCAKMDKTLFRDNVISQLMSVLIGKDKPNALLVGEAGVGKTRIVEELARMIASDDARLPDQIANAHVWELPLSNLVSGSSIVGQLEEKAQAVIDFAADKSNHVILFIDEIHQLMAGKQTYATIAQILKPALARGDIRVIGATTLQESQDLAHDPAFSRRFTRVIVDELTREQTVQILSNGWPSLSAHYKNAISTSDEMFEVIARVADTYATTGQHRPDNAMTLMDRVCADAVVERKEQLATISDPQLSKALSVTPLVITEAKATRCAMRIATGQSKPAKIDFDSLSEALDEIRGQDKQIASITRSLKLRELGLFPQTRPLTIMCAGPSGVGKSAVARIVAHELAGEDPITLNMAEFVTYASLNRIVGSPAGYVGSDSHRELPFDILESNPYQVILLDEMEKSCREVQRFFMSAFDDGYAKTNSGKMIDFSKCVFFVTTNASHTTGATRSAGFTAKTSSDAKANTSALSKWFDVELLNRFQLMLDFNEIDEATYREILAHKYRKEVARINTERPKLKLPAELTDDELDTMVKDTYEREFGARPAERTIRADIEEKALAQTI